MARRLARRGDRPVLRAHSPRLSACSPVWSYDQNLGANLGQVPQFLDMFIEKTESAVRRFAPDLAGVVGAVDSVVSPAEIERVRTQRIHGIAAGDLLWQ